MEKLKQHRFHVGEENTDHFALKMLASMFRCTVISSDEKSVVLEGTDDDLDDFSDFWERGILDERI